MGEDDEMRPPSALLYLSREQKLAISNDFGWQRYMDSSIAQNIGNCF